MVKLSYNEVKENESREWHISGIIFNIYGIPEELNIVNTSGLSDVISIEQFNIRDDICKIYEVKRDYWEVKRFINNTDIFEISNHIYFVITDHINIILADTLLDMKIVKQSDIKNGIIETLISYNQLFFKLRITEQLTALAIIYTDYSEDDKYILVTRDVEGSFSTPYTIVKYSDMDRLNISGIGDCEVIHLGYAHKLCTKNTIKHIENKQYNIVYEVNNGILSQIKYKLNLDTRADEPIKRDKVITKRVNNIIEEIDSMDNDLIDLSCQYILLTKYYIQEMTAKGKKASRGKVVAGLIAKVDDLDKTYIVDINTLITLCKGLFIINAIYMNSQHYIKSIYQLKGYQKFQGVTDEYISKAIHLDKENIVYRLELNKENVDKMLNMFKDNYSINSISRIFRVDPRELKRFISGDKVGVEDTESKSTGEMNKQIFDALNELNDNDLSIKVYNIIQNHLKNLEYIKLMEEASELEEKANSLKEKANGIKNSIESGN